MYGTPANRYPDVFSDEQETEIEEDNASLKDFYDMLSDMFKLAETAHILDYGINMSFGKQPLNVLNNTIIKHLEVIETLKEEIKDFERRNRLIITRLKEEENKGKELEKKVKQETKPKRRKTQLL
ncbi:hypothetical protein EDI_054730 [Entamoeba dispar SAW760]|uniref:Uncharacterized protein n=1 Tax=Entamoeba dispar (strain ATCC PRA-260 / SAW760) TaxID=370354 RepID=B0EB60_ENTDS|nr:uncharacterized protein EDI_054730 [Entamoeba dispar SAW760]EDR28244.1 hypothetical protein EDI_054730 [Entamoeba dispar SAW760]|eukprot:EDR28244.1 hypothetical protein EDI_054730 [Entamoeba dispar SAW760]